jgi:hypothetical protein
MSQNIIFKVFYNSDEKKTKIDFDIKVTFLLKNIKISTFFCWGKKSLKD